MNNDYGRALQIFQALYTAREFAKVLMYTTPSDVVAIYPHPETYKPYCYYDKYSKTIKIYSNNDKEDTNGLHPYSAWDTIMHEYGHHIACEKDIEKSPAGTHYSDVNMAERLENKMQGVRLVWNESWSTIFALMAQDYYRDKLTNIRFVCDAAETSFNAVNIDIENDPVALGEACEQSVMAVLWDLFDSNNENEYDTLSLGVAGFRDITMAKGTYTFSDCINNFYNRYPDNKEDVYGNLVYYNMAPYTIIVQNNKLTSLPKLSWTSGGGSTTYPNNLFDLHFYDSNENEILKIKDIKGNNYTLNEEQWNTILSADGNEYYCSVGGYNDYNNLKTGPYYCPKR